MLSQDDYKVLELFNEKVTKLENNSFVKHIFSQQIGFSMSWEKGKNVEFEKNFPEKESIDSFVLTLRYFIQNNEKISFQNIAKIYDKLPDSDQKKEFFKDAVAKLNHFLDAPDKQLTIKEKDKLLTKRDIFNTIIYGELAHANEEKREIYKDWMKNPLLATIIEGEFNAVLGTIMNVLRYIKGLNNHLIFEV
nr:hypothetical protein [uncultured Methanolobus sp.]